MSQRPVGSVWRRQLAQLAAAVLAGTLAACAGNGAGGSGSVNIANSQGGDPATVDYPIFYVKRPVPVNAAGALVQDDLRTLRDLVPGSDLYMRESASPSAVETNITARVTAGARYDVKDVDVSPDGTRVVFAMRGPLAKNQQAKTPPCWRIWQYVITTDTLAPVIDPSIDPDPATVNDVSPHYLADGRIVFSTTRQDTSQGVLLDEHKPGFIALDEDSAANQGGTQPDFVLEVMNADGTHVHQITFNPSHDQQATVLQSGRVLYSRWDHAPGHDAMSLYSANPDGTDVELYYGANSHMTGTPAPGTTTPTVVEFMQPHEIQGGGVMSLIRQYTGVDDGGNLALINGVNFVENNQPLAAWAGLAGPAQIQATPLNNIYTIPGPSPGGRFNSAYPLWDGTGRILVSWSECRLLDTTQTPPAVVPCTTSGLANPNAQTALPLYSLWMLDPVHGTLMPIAAPVEGVMISYVVATQPKPVPNLILDTAPTGQAESFASAGVGVIDIRSVYDICTHTPCVPGVDTSVPDIATVADPAKTAASARPARFIRLEKAVSIPDKTVTTLTNADFGVTSNMVEILGYAPIEPDGSVYLEVPANVAFRVSILDANARAITAPQGVWLQLLPGETVSCNGCHLPQGGAQNPLSHGRKGAFNSAWAGGTGGTAFPDTISSGPAAFIPQNNGETMAEARMAVSCATDTPPCLQMVPSVNVLYTDVWTDPAKAAQGTPITYSYTDATNPVPAIPTTALCATAWSSSCRIIINYPQHVQPVWDAMRTGMLNGVPGNVSCSQAGCHNPLSAAGAAQTPAGNLDLTNSVDANTNEFTSYGQLLTPHTTVIMGQPGPTVGPFMNAGSANGGASSAFFNCFATGSGCNNPSHTGWLNIAELRLLSEWLDIGAQYHNDPFAPAAPM
jgi:Hydrazine synthase alpha subunit middle domain